MRSINTSTDKYWPTLYNFVGRGYESMFELFLGTLVFDNYCFIVYYCFIWTRFYIIIKCIIGTFHIYRCSFRLIQRRPRIPLELTFRFESSHVFRRFSNNLINIEWFYFFLCFFERAIDLHYSLVCCFDITFRSIHIFISEP